MPTKKKPFNIVVLEELGFSDDEIDSSNGFRGLTKGQQEAFLTLQSRHVMNNARLAGERRHSEAQQKRRRGRP